MNYPQTWEEFCENYPLTDNDYFIGTGSGLTLIHKHGKVVNKERDVFYDRNLCVSKEECAAFIALMQLRQLYKVWIEVWEHENQKEMHFDWAAFSYPCIGQQYYTQDFRVFASTSPRVFCFPNWELAEEFLNCFRDLFNIAKPLI